MHGLATLFRLRAKQIAEADLDPFPVVLRR